MAEIEVIDRAGDRHRLALTTGATLMEVIRDADVEAEFALCGGNCSCATCHVYVDGTIGLSRSMTCWTARRIVGTLPAYPASFLRARCPRGRGSSSRRWIEA